MCQLVVSKHTRMLRFGGNFFDIQEFSSSGINEVSNVGKENHADVFYDANGVRHKNLIKGLNITKTKNGIVKKKYM